MHTDFSCRVTCPICFETFLVTGPAASETPASWDYDCEICCRPMIIHFYLDADEVIAEAEADQ